MERIDEIGFGNLKLIQEPSEFCYGVDSVILSDFASKGAASRAKTCVDLGTGGGIIPLILSHKTEWTKIYGIEVQKNSFDRAVRNAGLNGLEDRIEFINEDVKCLIEKRPPYLSDIDVVTMNPPYAKGSSGLVCDNRAKHIARTETTADLEDFIKLAALMLRYRGDCFMVHRPSRLVDICCLARKYGMEPKEIRPVSPKQDASPNIILVHLVKGGGSELKLQVTLPIHGDDGGYTPELMKCYE